MISIAYAASVEAVEAYVEAFRLIYVIKALRAVLPID